jgi:nicotinamidase-related amidase
MTNLRAYTDPHFSSSALITIDTQRDVLDGQPLEIAGTSVILPRMRSLAQAFRAARRPIVHVVRLYKRDGSNVDLCRRQAVEQGARILCVAAEGSQLASELLPDPAVKLDCERLLGGAPQQLGADEFALYKPRWGAFFQTALEQHLRERAVTTLVFAGCNFPNCPRASIYQASERDFRIVVARDAVSGIYPRGERDLHGIGATLMSAQDIADELIKLSTVAARS